jgi:hypothetical protein
MLAQMTRRTVALIAVLSTFGGCMSPPGHREGDRKARRDAPPDRVEKPRAGPAQSKTLVEKAPIDAPIPSDQHAQPDPIPASIGDMVADVALIHHGDLICSDGMQCNGTASWANCDRGSPKVAANDKVRVITDAGVEEMSVVLRGAREIVSVAPTSNSREIELGLALRNARPSATARLDARRLDANVSAAEAKAVRKWLEKTFPDSLGPTVLRPIGAVSGTFGDGVDRILVFAPKRRLTEEESGHHDQPLDHDVAVLLADGEPRGILPFETVTGLEVVHAVDLDGDGVQELMWIMQGPSVTLFTFFSISYFNGSEFATREVAGCTYAGCDDFLAAEQCGHSRIKWKNGRPDR